MAQKIELQLFADYFQFYLQDEEVEGNLADSWTKDAVDRLLAMTEGTIGIGTVRNMTVPVTVEVIDAEPAADDLSPWDQVNECDLEVKSGRIAIAGCTDYFPDAARIEVPPTTYRARIYYGNLDSLSQNGMEGDDHYRIVLWRAAPGPLKVLKQYKKADSTSSNTSEK
ncbi:MAG TPA: hypothetical protein VJO35_05190 [Terriglobales bacterium]|nr:hypothetical protein [Terriglobales bacterium]